MEKLEAGFKLFQPWANEVVKGKLFYLIRRTSTIKRERVAVIATEGIDGIWIQKASDKELKKIENNVGIIGSVEIKNCIEVKVENIQQELIKLTGQKYWENYPKHLIPKNEKTGKAYIWILDNALEWDNALSITGGGILWSKINKGQDK